MSIKRNRVDEDDITEIFRGHQNPYFADSSPSTKCTLASSSSESMVFGILTAVAACPAIIGTTEAIRQGQRQNAREEHRGRKSNLTIALPVRNSYSEQFDGAMVVLKDNKLYIDTEHSRLGANMAHPFSGYYLPVPWIGDKWKKSGFRHGEGMVTTISDDPPFLNWVYLDSNTYEVKYGTRVEAEPHHIGPWDCTPIDRRLTFEGWEGFVIVQEDEESDLWALYFDRDDDGLRGEGKVGTQNKRMLLAEISRKEMRRTKLVSDEERITRIREQADTEKRRAQAELEAGTISPTKEEPQDSSSQIAQGVMIETAPEVQGDTSGTSFEQGHSNSLDSSHVGNNDSTSGTNHATKDDENKTGPGPTTYYNNTSSDSVYQESSHSSSSFHTASYEMSSETQTSTTTW
ncbi:hypothetical protein E4T44_07668 [Aureobasidium sp. EXF-8845]|nr:hypothetical protein E4T44_07668 [Aureobasidium sp. EXF-8845]KAI4844402.1 hypothetical protein E4T45_08168 [Aureobasidium sp. EXF-8846]